MTEPLKLVIFDVDGTLIDSQDHILAAMNHAFAAVGHDAPARREVLSIVGLSLPEAIADCSLVLGTTARTREQHFRVLEVRAAGDVRDRLGGDRVQVVGLHQLRVLGDGAGPVGGLGAGPRGGEVGNDLVLALVADPVDNEAVDRRHDHAAVADLGRDLVLDEVEAVHAQPQHDDREGGRGGEAARRGDRPGLGGSRGLGERGVHGRPDDLEHTHGRCSGLSSFAASSRPVASRMRTARSYSEPP